MFSVLRSLAWWLTPHIYTEQEVRKMLAIELENERARIVRRASEIGAQPHCATCKRTTGDVSPRKVLTTLLDELGAKL